MLPKGPLGRQMYKKLKVYAGPEHNHAAQKPEHGLGKEGRNRKWRNSISVQAEESPQLPE